jgi:hypothetical protein
MATEYENKMFTDTALDSLQNAIAFSSRDWSLDKRDAWIYGIIMGWDDSIESVAKLHNWSVDDVERLNKYRMDLISTNHIGDITNMV